jgi:alkaline phosphatase D
MGFQDPVSRRTFLKSAGLLAGAAAVPWGATSTVNAAPVPALTGGAPQLRQGIQIGDVRADRAVVWSRSDRPARLLVDYDVRESFANPRRVRGPFALDTSDYTARVDVTGLPNDSNVFVRVMFQDLSNDRIVSDPVRGSFRTAPVKNRAIRFLWSGDTAGQGWGINPDGGMKIYEAMRQTRPDFFIHCGDTIYADGPIQ